MPPIDLRSDTVTCPDQAMRQAMANAQVGDDVFGEDPTINRLQEMAAQMLGKEAALYVPSGTMANQINLRVLTRPGDEVICDQYAHCYRFEGGAGAALSGLSFYPLPGKLGILSPEQVASVIQGDNIHYPVSKVVALENTHNRGNGAVYPLDTIKAIASLARDNGLHMHLDGARMFHACLAGGYSPSELASHFDTISFCLSKGLGAPVGSMVVSTAQNIKQALRERKRLGGGMRQAGILAAAGIYALENNIERLAEDHQRAQKLAQAVANMKGVKLDPAEVVTNIVIFDVSPSGLSPAEVLQRLAGLGLRLIPFGGYDLRAVLHLHIDDAALDEAIKALAKVLD
jgi:threonine aldolase